jgi:Flp pilus assembly protein TadD
MSPRAAGLALALFLCGVQAVSAQTYGNAPAPRSTDPAAMSGAAIAREIKERFALGITALNGGDYSTAISQFEEVLRRKPGEPQGSTAHYNLALALAGAKQFERAHNELKAAIALDPGFLAAYANLITIDLRRGDDAGARQAADKFAALAPNSARALYSRGIVALRAGDTATARADFSRLLEKNPAYAPAHYDLALVALRSGRFDVAERELHAALDSSADYPRARFALGIVLLREGRQAEARVAFEQVEQGASDPVLRNMARSLHESLPQ